MRVRIGAPRPREPTPCSIGGSGLSAMNERLCASLGWGTLDCATVANPTFEICGKGLDDDGSGLADNDDPDCG